jgi:hypothetical protein
MNKRNAGEMNNNKNNTTIRRHAMMESPLPVPGRNLARTTINLLVR